MNTVLDLVLCFILFAFPGTVKHQRVKLLNQIDSSKYLTQFFTILKLQRGGEDFGMSGGSLEDEFTEKGVCPGEPAAGEVGGII